MKVLTVLLALALVVVGTLAVADQRVSSDKPSYAIYRNVVVDTVVADSGGLTWFTDAGLTQADKYWIAGTMTVIDGSSDLTDSTRTIAGFDGGADSMTFSAFATDSVEKGDSLEIVIPTHYRYNPPIYGVAGMVIDSLMICTTEAYRMTPGAAITSVHLIQHSRDKDSTGTNIVLQIAVDHYMPNMDAGWWRDDSISYATQDTLHYKAWGAKQANYFRFILEPINAEVDSCTITHYGQVMVDD